MDVGNRAMQEHIAERLPATPPIKMPRKTRGIFNLDAQLGLDYIEGIFVRRLVEGAFGFSTLHINTSEDQPIS